MPKSVRFFHIASIEPIDKSSIYIFTLFSILKKISKLMNSYTLMFLKNYERRVN